jgi:Pyruvate/2-oxoglutarate dehydrogenase complex, dihydrolipoamide dehydrogenase (E3) component, and related enzymes
MFRRFGSRVTVVQRGRQLLPLEDEDVAGAVLDILHEDGIEVLLGSQAVRAASHGSGVRLTVRTPDGERDWTARTCSVPPAGCPTPTA